MKRNGNRRKLKTVFAITALITGAIVSWHLLHPAPTLPLPEIVYYEVDNKQQTRSQNPLDIWIQSLIHWKDHIGTLNGVNAGGSATWAIRNFYINNWTGDYNRPAHCAAISDGMLPITFFSPSIAVGLPQDSAWLDLEHNVIYQNYPEWDPFSGMKTHDYLIPVYDLSKSRYLFREEYGSSLKEYVFKSWNNTAKTWDRLQLQGMTHYTQSTDQVIDAAFYGNTLILVAKGYLEQANARKDNTTANTLSFFDLTTNSFTEHYMLCIANEEGKYEPILAEANIDNSGNWALNDSAPNYVIARSREIAMDKRLDGFSGRASIVRPSSEGESMLIYLTWTMCKDGKLLSLNSGFFNFDAYSGELTPSEISVNKDLRLLQLQAISNHTLNWFDYEPKSGTAITTAIDLKTKQAVLILISKNDQVTEIPYNSSILLDPGYSVSPSGYIWFTRRNLNSLTPVLSFLSVTYYSDLIRYDPATGKQTVVVVNAPISGLWSWLE